MISISKERFCAILNKLRDQNDIYFEVSDKLSGAIGMTIDLIPLSPIMDDLLYLLSVVTRTDLDDNDDSTKNSKKTFTLSMIEFFVYELDYGRSYEDGRVEEIDGTPIKLDSAEALYDCLVKCDNEND